MTPETSESSSRRKRRRLENGATLQRLAYTEAQGDRWQRFEDEEKVTMAYDSTSRHQRPALQEKISMAPYKPWKGRPKWQVLYGRICRNTVQEERSFSSTRKTESNNTTTTLWYETDTCRVCGCLKKKELCVGRRVGELRKDHVSCIIGGIILLVGSITCTASLDWGITEDPVWPCCERRERN